MADQIFDDETLTDVLDGTADALTVAAVQASATASARLDSMRRAAELVGTAPTPATAERRSASIAGALAAAQAPPEIRSLSVARQQKVTRDSWYRRPELLAVAAAVVVVLLTLPFLASIGSDDADTASTAETADAASTDAGASLDAGDGADGSTDDEAMEDTAALAEAAPATTAAAARAADDDAAADDGAGEFDAEADGGSTNAVAPIELRPVSSIEGIDDQIELGWIEPRVTLGDLETQGLVLPECTDTVLDEVGPIDESVPSFDAVMLTEPGQESTIVIVYFATDGTTGLFNGEDCSTIR
ncbi:MAG: hypothetical protein ACR2P0_02445 [Acidimicrobiales bacterium]